VEAGYITCATLFGQFLARNTCGPSQARVWSVGPLWSGRATVLLTWRLSAWEGARPEIVRVLITVSPRLYREALAFAVERNRPQFDVKSASSEDIHPEVKGFGLDVLVRMRTTMGWTPRCWRRFPSG
jgi:hypothetical protein